MEPRGTPGANEVQVEAEAPWIAISMAAALPGMRRDPWGKRSFAKGNFMIGWGKCWGWVCGMGAQGPVKFFQVTKTSPLVHHRDIRAVNGNGRFMIIWLSWQ